MDLSVSDDENSPNSTLSISLEASDSHDRTSSWHERSDPAHVAYEKASRLSVAARSDLECAGPSVAHGIPRVVAGILGRDIGILG